MCEIKCDNADDLISVLGEDYDEIRFIISWKGQFQNIVSPRIVLHNSDDEKIEILKNTLNFLYVQLWLKERLPKIQKHN